MTCDSIFKLFLYDTLCEYRMSIFKFWSYFEDNFEAIWFRDAAYIFSNICNSKFNNEPNDEVYG